MQHLDFPSSLSRGFMVLMWNRSITQTNLLNSAFQSFLWPVFPATDITSKFKIETQWKNKKARWSWLLVSFKQCFMRLAIFYVLWMKKLGHEKITAMWQLLPLWNNLKTINCYVFFTTLKIINVWERRVWRPTRHNMLILEAEKLLIIDEWWAKKKKLHTSTIAYNYNLNISGSITFVTIK